MNKLLSLLVPVMLAGNAIAAEDKVNQKTQTTPSISVPVTDPDDPQYIVEPGTGYDGVVEIFVGDGGGTGALLSTGRHILTAAHLWDGGNQEVNPAEVEVVFSLPSGFAFFNAVSFTLHPGYDEDDVDTNNDIAIIELAESAPPQADRYEIYRGSDEVGQVVFKVGYGLRGTGFTGQDENDPESVLRMGENQYDALGDSINEELGTSIIPGSQLIFDFDNGEAANDAAGIYLGIEDAGLGLREVNTTSGDSGGPSFWNNQIVGVVSYGFSPADFELALNSDIDDLTNSTFGEFSSDTRVSFYADWIDSVAGTSPVTGVDHFELY